MSDTKPTGRQRDAATIELLKNLRERLLSDNISTARVAAYRLSWLQEDGLALLKEALFGQYPRTAKKAAAYGLRNMKGRMKKMAKEVLEQGLTHRDRTTQAACKKSIDLMNGVAPKPQKPHQRKPRSSRRKIHGTSGNRARRDSGNIRDSKPSFNRH